MFEPLPGLMRQRREQMKLTQDELARRADVSRGQLIAFEKGSQNISLLLLLRIARALEMTELPVADLHLVPAAPELTALVAAADAVAAAERVIAQASSAAEQLEQASGAIRTLLQRALEVRGSNKGLVAAAERLGSARSDTAKNDRAIREIVESPTFAPRRGRRPNAAKAAPPRTRTR